MARISGVSNSNLPQVRSSDGEPVTTAETATASAPTAGWAASKPERSAGVLVNDPLLGARTRIDQAIANAGAAVLYLSTAVMKVATTEQKIKALAQVLKCAVDSQAGNDGDTHGLALEQLKTIIDTISSPDEFDRVFHSVDNRALLDTAMHPEKLRQQLNMNLARTRAGDWGDYSRYLDTVTGTTPTTGNSIDFLVDGPAVMNAIRPDFEKATKSIDISIFQWEADDIGWEFARALAAKANPTDPSQPKVAVRVLLDEKGTVVDNPKRAKDLIKFLRQNNVEVIVNPTDLFRSHLDHRKLIVIDGETAYTGGMNIGASYQRNWHDQQSRITGPIVASLANHFRSRWQEEGGTLLPNERAAPPPARRGPDEARAVAHTGAMADTHIKAAYLKAIYTAEKQISLANPYFADPDIVKGLCDAAKRGVQVRVLLPLQNDEGLLRAAARAYYPEMIAAGVEVYEYTPRMAHNKVATIDGKWSTFGSSNLDARSLRYNDELNVVSLDPSVARQIEEKMFTIDLANSTRITSYTPSNKELLLKAASRYL